MILDVCCSAEKIYHGRQSILNDAEFITMDIRKGDFSYQVGTANTPTNVIVNPKVLADMQYIPFRDNSFDIIICDPPFMDFSLTSFGIKAWGSWTQQESISIMKLANAEFSRVLDPNGTIILKTTGVIEDRYIKLLSNFIFFLPIQTVRAKGFIKNKEMKQGAKWFIGVRKHDV